MTRTYLKISERRRGKAIMNEKPEFTTLVNEDFEFIINVVSTSTAILR